MSRLPAADGRLALSDTLSLHLPFEQALLVSGVATLVGTLVAMPRIMRKLLGAKIIGRDINKPDRPVVPEMGGVGVFLGFNAGVFVALMLSPLPTEQVVLILVALITAAGAALTGVMDDLVELRQRFKAFIPIVFAAPLALYVADDRIVFPLVGAVSFGIVYPLILVPLGIACAANGFNMLEGYNGLGAGVGLIMAIALSVLVVLAGHPEALVLLVPLAAALLAFLWFNRYPARVFPGDTMTLLVGAVLAAAAMIGKVEFWGALLFLPHIAEFVLKARGRFEAENFAKRVAAEGPGAPRLEYEGPIESLTHVVLKRLRPTEWQVSAVFWGLEAVLAIAIIACSIAAR